MNYKSRTGVCFDILVDESRIFFVYVVGSRDFFADHAIDDHLGFESRNLIFCLVDCVDISVIALNQYLSTRG